MEASVPSITVDFLSGYLLVGTTKIISAEVIPFLIKNINYRNWDKIAAVKNKVTKNQFDRISFLFYNKKHYSDQVSLLKEFHFSLDLLQINFITIRIFINFFFKDEEEIKTKIALSQ